MSNGFSLTAESTAPAAHFSLANSASRNAHVEAARSVVKRIQRGDLSRTFTLRDVYRRGWAHLPDAEAARAAMDVLEAKGLVFSRLTQPGVAGGRPSLEYSLVRTP